MMQPNGIVVRPLLENGFKTSKSKLEPLWFSVVQTTLADCSTSHFMRISSVEFISCIQTGKHAQNYANLLPMRTATNEINTKH